jgi:hypothetical protein
MDCLGREADMMYAHDKMTPDELEQVKRYRDAHKRWTGIDYRPVSLAMDELTVSLPRPEARPVPELQPTWAQPNYTLSEQGEVI